MMIDVMSFRSGFAQGVSRDIAWRVEVRWEVDRSTSTARLQIATFGLVAVVAVVRTAGRVAGTIIETMRPFFRAFHRI